MFSSKHFSVAVSILLVAVTISCSYNKQNNTNIVKTLDFSFVINNNYLSIQSQDTNSVSLRFSVNHDVFFDFKVSTNKNYAIIDILKSQVDNYYNFASILAKNGGNLNINIQGLGKDTIITFHIQCSPTKKYDVRVLSGLCAKLERELDDSNLNQDVIHWLYQKGERSVSNSYVDSVTSYLKELKKTSYDNYITHENIPVVTSLSGITYKIESDLKAEHYYLFASKSEEDIDKFVEDMVSNGFDGGANNLSTLSSCFRSQNTLGTACIFLIGINNDWNFHLIPVGLICIDNIKPSTKPSNNYYSSNIVLKKERLSIKMPNNIPAISGYASLDTREWGGNGLSCNVNFIVAFGGDVKSISLERNGNLAKYIGKGKLVLDLLKKKSPYIFTYELHLEDGDNYVPVTITDLRGNKIEYKFNVPCTMTRNNAPSINIDNDVDVNVW